MPIYKIQFVVFVYTFVCILCLSAFADSVYTVHTKDYEAVKNTKDFRIYITGIGEGYGWANTELESRKQKPLYCQPNKFAFTPENYFQILDEKMKEKKRIDWSKVDTTVELVLLINLMENFPCKQ